MRKLPNLLILILVIQIYSCTDNGIEEDVVPEEEMIEKENGDEVPDENGEEGSGENTDPTPTFTDGNDPISSEKEWVLVENLSDEFDGNSLDNTKWSADPKFEYVMANGNIQNRGWYGSKRSLFEIENVTVTEGELRIEAEKFPSNRYAATDDTSKEATRAYGGGKVTSKNLAETGFYMEAEIRASTTVMSSAYWLSTPSIPCKELEQEERLELDILECVGRISGTTTDDWPNDDWAVNSHWDKIFHSNVFRHPTQNCFQGVWNENKETYEAQRDSGKLTLLSKNSEEFHVYGCHWKEDGMDFYLDGEYVYSIDNPGVPFLTPMNLIFSSNYYDWLKREDAENGGFNEKLIDRSTRFKWVRTWKLEDKS